MASRDGNDIGFDIGGNSEGRSFPREDRSKPGEPDPLVLGAIVGGRVIKEVLGVLLLWGVKLNIRRMEDMRPYTEVMLPEVVRVLPEVVEAAKSSSKTAVGDAICHGECMFIVVVEKLATWFVNTHVEADGVTVKPLTRVAKEP